LGSTDGCTMETELGEAKTREKGWEGEREREGGGREGERALL
jgi:hypothetical protein